jgi:hypothetical protein
MSTIPVKYAPKDYDAYERGDVCYIDERGTAYTRADFLAACNADEQVARRLFDLCYWQSPAFQFALFDESILLPDLSHHSKIPAHWLIFQKDPTAQELARLVQGGWTAQDLRTWIIEQEECCVPTGIAYRETGTRDRMPKAEALLHKESFAQEDRTHASEVRREQFVNDVDARLARMASITCYRVEQLPEHLDAWNSMENANGRGLRTLLHSRVVESIEALWQSLDGLPANCSFVVTELKNLREAAQIKANMRGGTIIAAQSREMDSTLIPVFSAVSNRLNQEPLRERLLRRWHESYAIREERISVEKHRLEWLPLHRRLSTNLFQDWEAETVEPAKDILTFLGWQSAYSFVLETVTFLPDEVTPEMAQAFLADLAKMREEVTVALVTADPESIWRIVQEGRSHAFTLLEREVRAFLSSEQGLPLIIAYEYDLGFYGGNYTGAGDARVCSCQPDRTTRRRGASF